MLAVALAMSLTYSASSCIPYLIGFKFQEKLGKLNEGFFRNGLEKAQQLFSRYGEWSIAAARPAGAGMFISFIAGIGRVKLWKYLLFTILGTYPWYFFLLYLGFVHKGNAERVLILIQTHKEYIFAGAAAAALIWAGISFFRHRIFR